MTNLSVAQVLSRAVTSIENKYLNIENSQVSHFPQCRTISADWSIRDIRGPCPTRLSSTYSEVPVHDHHVYYAYEPSAPSHASVATSKHNYGGGHKSSASMSALTLLAFLFFLHILQQCIKDHMTDMSTAPVMIMTAGREGDDAITKGATFNKLDKTGMTESNFEDIPDNDQMDGNKQNKLTEKYGEKNPYDIEGLSNKHQLMKIKTAHVTKSDETKRKYVLKNYANRSNGFAGFYSAMDEE